MRKKSDIQLKTFKGSHKEMGAQQGRACVDIIKHSHSMLATSPELKAIKPFFLPTGLFLKLAKMKMWGDFAAGIKKDSPRQHARLEGIAEGAGENMKHMIFLQSMEIEMAKTHFIGGACSAAAVAAERSASGEPIIIKNFDYPEFFSPTHLVRMDVPSDGYRVLAATNAPLAGSHDSINERGLSITYNYGYGQDASSNSVPMTMALQDTLEKCGTTAEAIEFLRKCKYNGCALWMICDAQGDLRSVEISKTMVDERKPKEGVIAHTNHYLTERLAKVDVPPSAVYSRTNVPALRGKRCRESSEVRLARLEELLSKQQKFSEEDLVRIFSDHGADGIGSDNTVCRHSDYFCTTLSVILYPASKKFKVLYGRPCEYEYAEFAF